jgi:hypothetical protein
MHGITGGIMSDVQGGSFASGFAAGAVSSLVSSGIQAAGQIGVATPLTTTALVNGQLQTEAADAKVRIDVNKSRKKVFTGLTPGVSYHFYVTASNTAGVAPLSDVKSLMAA